MTELRNCVIRREISRNENPTKIINIVEKILEFSKQRKGNGLKILTPKQMFQRLPIAGNTSENLLNKICQIIRYLYRAKEITKKVYNNTMNSKL